MTRTPTRIAVVGAAGRMGREVVRAALEDDSIELAGGVVETGAPELGADIGELCGLGRSGVRDARPAGRRGSPDRVHGARCDRRAPYARPVVIGTTGLSEEQLARVEEAAKSVPIVLAPNMSVGVSLSGRWCASSPGSSTGYDVEIVEAHHRNKVDAPSGTALLLARAAAEGRGRNLDEVAVFGREGRAPREEGEIGIHALRGGAVVGEHRVVFYSDGEEIEIAHRALSRRTSPRAL